jgi:hypothetical protein
MPDDRNLLSLDASLAIPMHVLHLNITDRVVTHRSDRCSTPVRLVRPTSKTVLELLHLHLRFFSLGFVDQPRNPVVFW